MAVNAAAGSNMSDRRKEEAENLPDSLYRGISAAWVHVSWSAGSLDPRSSCVQIPRRQKQLSSWR